LTDTTPKPLIQAGPKRLIEYLIDNLVVAGFDDLIINYAHLGEQFPQTLGDGSRYQAHIQYSPETEGGLETAGGIINALPLLGDEPFVVVNGDIWTDYDFDSLRRFQLAPNQLCHLVMVSNPPHNPNGDFAVTADGQLAFEGAEKWTFSGIAVYNPALFNGLASEKRPLKPLFEQAIKQQQASAEVYRGEWSDIGTVERLEALEKQLTKPA
jgi:MurNAc alpha-1-phosphate uridylyltransferase